MLLNLIHVNLNVADLERSIAFYQRLGMGIMQVFGDLAAGVELADGSRVRGVVMSISDDPRAATKLELVQWLDPPPEPSAPRGMRTLGVGRLAIRVRGFEALCRRLRGEGVDFAVEPRAESLAGARVFAVLRDPDGNLVELVELATPEPDTA